MNDTNNAPEIPFDKHDRKPVAYGTEAGLYWVTMPAPLHGAVNGYVKLPEGHPWLELDLQMADYEVAHVHGGVTYGPTRNWIGFDTLHAGDIWPGSDEFMRGLAWERPWTAEAVAEETKALARQAAAVIA